MANLIKTLTARVIEARGTNKAFPCKTYKTEEAAEKATSKAADEVGQYFAKAEGTGRQAHYMVVYIAQWDKWVGFINQSEVLSRQESTGGYLGICEGFFKW